MEYLESVSELEVQKCWIVHEQKSRGSSIGIRALAAIGRHDYKTALFAYRGNYPKQIFDNLKQWEKAKLNLNDIKHLRHVHCELDNLSEGSLMIVDAVENIINNPELSDPKKNPDSYWHVQDIMKRLKELATDSTPVIVGEDYVRNDGITIIFDGFHRLIATLIYHKKRQSSDIISKEAYYGSR